MPASFKHATVHCIPKCSKPATGLDYRPIVLLNTDYKILTRILATRLAPVLDEVIQDSQSGYFVPGRNIHDTIDLAFLAKHLAKTGRILRDALVPLLDFSKAYDSVDRDFLMEALRWHGFLTAFIDIIRALHGRTTARFRANGHLSQEVDVFNGIRQGCPLAPLLFILAVDMFRRIELSPSTPGILIPIAHGPRRIPIVGYADDIAL